MLEAVPRDGVTRAVLDADGVGELMLEKRSLMLDDCVPERGCGDAICGVVEVGGGSTNELLPEGFAAALDGAAAGVAD